MNKGKHWTTSLAENIEKESQVDEVLEVVKKYFDNVLKLPCPDFRYNLKNKKSLNKNI